MSKSILIIDDEELIVKSLLKLLGVQGYKADVARSGKEALEKIKSADFDLLICDVRMPDLDGVETIRQIRTYLAQSNKKPVPEILITGYADADKYEEAMALKVADYLYKPFDNIQLLQAVKGVIG